MRVFLCEKPSQGKDIARHVGAHQRAEGCLRGDGVMVTWAIGHLLEQAKPEHYNPALKSWALDLLPITPKQWVMDVKPSTKDQFMAVQAALKRATEVIIATDADREGEVIAREVLDRVGYRGPIRRLWLGALDDVSVRKALAKLLPNDKTLPMYASGLGRSRADWLVGMNMTMALTSAFGEGGRGGVLHCGRVQTVVLGLIVRLERAIAVFQPKIHYVLSVSFEVHGTVLPMQWVAQGNPLGKDAHCLQKAVVDSVVQKIQHKLGRVSQVTTTPERELAPLLYSLGSLQREASAKYGLKAQAVLDACQALYEKHKATTYPRTDCEYLPQSMHADVPTVLQAIVQAQLSLAKLVERADVGKPGRVFNDKKITAHHAIVPTLNPCVRIRDMSDIERLVYDMVRRRYLAQFLGDYRFNKTTIGVVCEGHEFTATGRTPTSMGWKRAYDGMEQPVKAKPAKAEVEPEQVVLLPPAVVGDQAINRKAETVKTATKPPKRYTEGTLLAAMESIEKEIDDPRLKKVMQNKEKAGIGTDATRSSVIEGLFKRGYIANDKKFIVPTERGMHSITQIEAVAGELVDPVLTAIWEDKLSQIEAGSMQLAQFELELADWLQALVAKMRTQAKPRPTRISAPGVSQTAAGTVTSSPVYPCPSCSKPMRPRSSQGSAFWGCSDYPACRCTLPDVGGKPGLRQGVAQALPVANAARLTVPAGSASAAASTPTQRACDTCGKAMVLRRGVNGPFYGCSGFPVCRNTAVAVAKTA